eukprot:CAMPEP_0119466228 /NCGR_PEP_ID=MMETSP1344-20130328/984_1 /TAXON_ID=236787 /ORGANISM="Florenciella parvula, Strain CCMP2471" /LENGTH=52 /DNA_ID=CAMNT_0007498529 /DNA_START=167 /DNA_END=322 /DNA_ORIENTATION=-
MAVGRRNRGLFGNAQAFAVAALLRSTATSAFMHTLPIDLGHAQAAGSTLRGA